MARYVLKSGVVVDAEQFHLYRPCNGVTRYCCQHIVKSPIGMQTLRNLDYVIAVPSGGYFAMPKDIFELLMERSDG